MRSKSWWFASSLVPVALAAIAGVPINLPKALATQEQLVQAEPANAAAQVDLGNLLLLGGRSAEAEAAYRQAIALDPASTSAHFDLGLLLQQQGENSAAAKQYEEVLRLDPGHAWAHYQLGVLREGRGSERAAIRSYAKAFALEPRLRFSDVNPHVVENRLVTQAMLYAYRNELPPIQPGAAYEEPARIANILIGGRDAAGKAAQAVPHADAIPEPPEAASGGAAARTLRPGDLSRVGSSGQASPAGSVSSRRAPSRVLGTGEPADVEMYEPPVPTLRIPTPGEQPGVVPYQPALPSSGRLEMRLRDLAGHDIGRG